MNERGLLKRRWLVKGALGAVLLGAGISCAVESGFLKHDGADWYVWVAAGTGALCLVVAGTVFLIQSGVTRHKIDVLSQNDD